MAGIARRTPAPPFGSLAGLGVAIMVLAFLAQDRVYGVIPSVFVLILGIVAGTFALIVPLGLWTKPGKAGTLSRGILVAVATAEGVALSIYGMGNLRLSLAGPLILPAIFLLASVTAILAPDRLRTGSEETVTALAIASSLVPLLPAVYDLLPLYLSEACGAAFSISVFLATLFGLLYFFGMLGLLLAFL